MGPTPRGEPRRLAPPTMGRLTRQMRERKSSGSATWRLRARGSVPSGSCFATLPPPLQGRSQEIKQSSDTEGGANVAHRKRSSQPGSQQHQVSQPQHPRGARRRIAASSRPVALCRLRAAGVQLGALLLQEHTDVLRRALPAPQELRVRHVAVVARRAPCAHAIEEKDARPAGVLGVPTAASGQQSCNGEARTGVGAMR